MKPFTFIAALVFVTLANASSIPETIKRSAQEGETCTGVICLKGVEGSCPCPGSVCVPLLPDLLSGCLDGALLDAVGVSQLKLNDIIMKSSSDVAFCPDVLVGTMSTHGFSSPRLENSEEKPDVLMLLVDTPSFWGLCICAMLHLLFLKK